MAGPSPMLPDRVMNHTPAHQGVDALADNGGPTATHRLLAGATAQNAVDCVVPIDQRGTSRPAAPGACDAGAYEEASTGPLHPTATVVAWPWWW